MVTANLHPTKLKQLLQDIEGDGGYRSPLFRFARICNANKEFYGGKGTAKRRTFQLKMGDLKRKTVGLYMDLLVEHGITPAANTNDHFNARNLEADETEEIADPEEDLLGMKAANNDDDKQLAEAFARMPTPSQSQPPRTPSRFPRSPAINPTSPYVLPNSPYVYGGSRAGLLAPDYMSPSLFAPPHHRQIDSAPMRQLFFRLSLLSSLLSLLHFRKRGPQEIQWRSILISQVRSTHLSRLLSLMKSTLTGMFATCSCSASASLFLICICGQPACYQALMSCTTVPSLSKGLPRISGFFNTKNSCQ